MALEDHPNVFRFDGRLWVSELPREQMHAQLVEQRAWDAAHVKSERWTWAIAIGAAAGCAVTLGLGTLVAMPPAIYLVLLPIGFGIGAVLGAVINKRILAAAGKTPASTPRPVLDELLKIPAAVARKTDESTPTADLMERSRKGFVPGN